MPIKTPRTFVITLGGNSLLRAKEKGNTEDQYRNLWQTSQQLLELLSSGNRIVIAQGNGPQVGNLLLALESSRHIVPSMSLDICVAATQGFIGYMLQKTIADCLLAGKERTALRSIINNH